MRDLSEETAGAGGEMERGEKAKERDRERGRSGERGRDMRAKQEGDRESSPTVCRLLTRGLFSPSD